MRQSRLTDRHHFFYSPSPSNRSQQQNNDKQNLRSISTLVKTGMVKATVSMLSTVTNNNESQEQAHSASDEVVLNVI